MFRIAVRSNLRYLHGCLSLVWAITAVAAVPVHTLHTDLRPLIRAAIGSPARFAVSVPHSVSLQTAGSWSLGTARATWSYAVRVPTAVSMSFHAVGVSLPASATLVVRSARTSVSYRSRDLKRGELWSRIQPGDTLQFELSVASTDRAAVSLDIVSVQAGYRSLGAGVQDHPYYRSLKARAATTGNATCVTNYECEVSGANTPPAAATMALIIGNQIQCTGVLINDVPQDNTPYVLTARHCESDKIGGGDPAAAATVAAYWDATTPCGGTLGSIYDPNVPMQSGASTIVEQQDAWLILLDSSPIVSDAQFAGFDASGGLVQGGYTIHHGAGHNKQFTGWSGIAASVQQSNVLGSSYVSNFWDTVNGVGAIAPGASGSGLFDQSNHLVGSLTLGRTTNDSSGYESCPVSPPPAPNGSNGVADFTALSAVWASTADGSSSTGAATLRSTLDPANTGTLIVPSAPAQPITLTASADSLADGTSLQLSWNVAGATQCMASAGLSGDGWAGVLAASGTQSLTESVASLVTYTLTCTFSGGRAVHTSVDVSWTGPGPNLMLTAPAAVWTSTPATLSWKSNLAPCSLQGGGLSLGNLAGSGTATDTQATAGDVNYVLKCGGAAENASTSTMVSYVTPSLVLNPYGTDRKIGETFWLQWVTYADSCTPSGGAPGDGWNNTSFVGWSAQSQEPFYLTVTTPGTYTYTLTCSTGALSQQQSVTVTFENNPGYVTDSISASTVTYSDSPADYVTLTFMTNLSGCGFNSTPTGLVETLTTDPYETQGQAVLTPSQSGTYQLSLGCATAANPSMLAVYAAPLTLKVLPPPPPTASITFTPNSVVVGQSFQAAWAATNSHLCTLGSGIPNTPWGGEPGLGVALTGYEVESAQTAGQYTFSITCDSIDPNSPAVTTQATITIGALDATLSSSATSVTQSGSFTISWSSDGATGCTASGGGADGGSWTGSLPTSGSITQAASVAGSFTYSLVCSNGGQSTTVQNVTVQVTSNAATVSGSGSGGKSGGGGALGGLELMFLGAFLYWRRRARASDTCARQ